MRPILPQVRTPYVPRRVRPWPKGQSTTSAPSWNVASLTQDFYLGTAGSQSLASRIDNWNPATHELQVTAGTLQSGVTLDAANVEVDYDGAGAIANATVTVSIVPKAVDLTTVEVLSAVGGADVGFALGHAFAEGDVPSGAYISTDTSGVSALRADVKNRWPDGSVKFAVLCGRATLTAATPKTIAVRRVGADPGGTAVSIADLKATGISASIEYGAYGTVSWSGTDWDTPFAWKGGSSEAEKAVAYTAAMSSWLYRKPIGADAHLVGWLEVRCWANGQVEVVPWIENGYLLVASPGARTGTATFTLGGTQRFSQSLALPHHTRAVLASGTTYSHWLGTDPQLSWKHDRAYLEATKLVPRYRAQTPSTGDIWTRLTTSYTPLAQADYPNTMGAGGYHRSIGMLPQWSAAYITSNGDIRAWRSMLVNSLVAGRYCIHYRDETTNRPLRFSQHPGLAYNPTNRGASNPGSSDTYTPEPTGSVIGTFAWSHQPDMSAFAYMITGRHYFMEETQFQATHNYMHGGSSGRFGSDGVMRSDSSVRGAGWAMRTLGYAATFTPDADPLRAEFIASIDANIDWYHSTHVVANQNPLGYTNPGNSYKPWMDDFNMASWAQVKDQKVYTSANMDAWLAWRFRFIVGRFGGQGATEYCYRDAARYGFDAGADFDAVMAATNFGELYLAVVKAANDCNSGTDLRESADDPQTGYWGNLHPAIAAAVNHGATGADLAWERMTGASNYETYTYKFNDVPEWSVVPRGWEIP